MIAVRLLQLMPLCSLFVSVYVNGIVTEEYAYDLIETTKNADGIRKLYTYPRDSTVNIVAGYPLDLYCIYKNLTISWFVQRSDREVFRMAGNHFHESNTSNLMNEVYKCKVNGTSDLVKLFRIFVLPKPKITSTTLTRNLNSSINVIIAKQYQMLEISCSMDTEHDIKLFWEYNRNPTGLGSVQVTQSSHGNHKSTRLFFTSVEPVDSGLYYCAAKSPSATLEYRESVSLSVDVYSVQDAVHVLDVEEGQSFTLNCHKNIVDQKSRWYKLSAGSKWSNFQIGQAMTILRAKDTDSGTYKCDTTNPHYTYIFQIHVMPKTGHVHVQNDEVDLTQTVTKTSVYCHSSKICCNGNVLLVIILLCLAIVHKNIVSEASVLVLN